jgi:hypothetical protein
MIIITKRRDSYCKQSRRYYGMVVGGFGFRPRAGKDEKLRVLSFLLATSTATVGCGIRRNVQVGQVRSGSGVCLCVTPNPHEGSEATWRGQNTSNPKSTTYFCNRRTKN